MMPKICTTAWSKRLRAMPSRWKRLLRETTWRAIAAAINSKTTTPNAATALRTRRGTSGSIASVPTMMAASVIESTICSATTVPAMVEVGTFSPSICQRRRSTEMRATSPRRATRMAFSRKPMKRAGKTCE